MVPALDRLLCGGLPRGGFVELSGRRSCGRFSIGIAALASATSSGEAAALVDLGSHLDPQAAEAAGVELERLLWVRPEKLKDAVASAEMLLSAGFPLVVLDLGLAPVRGRFTPDAAWVRLERAARSRNAALLLARAVPRQRRRGRHRPFRRRRARALEGDGARAEVALRRVVAARSAERRARADGGGGGGGIADVSSPPSPLPSPPSGWRGETIGPARLRIPLSPRRGERAG